MDMPRLCICDRSLHKYYIRQTLYRLSNVDDSIYFLRLPSELDGGVILNDEVNLL